MFKVSKTYLRVCPIKSRRNKRNFRHVNFSYGEWKCQYCCCKLPKYCGNVTDDAEQSYLNSSKSFDCLHHLSKYSEGKNHCIEAVKVITNNERSIVHHRRSRWRPYGNLKEKCASVHDKSDEVQTVPATPVVRIEKKVN